MVERYLGICFFLLILPACNIQTGICPTETVVESNSERDFGFEGTWLVVPNDQINHDLEPLRLEIERNDSYLATIFDTDNTIHIEYLFRAIEIDKTIPHAIVEIESKDRLFRRLAIAAVADDRLYLWMIDGRKIGGFLYDQGTAAVIEHFKFSSSIRCKPKDLIECIRNHSRDVTGSYQVFHRKTDE